MYWEKFNLWTSILLIFFMLINQWTLSKNILNYSQYSISLNFSKIYFFLHELENYKKAHLKFFFFAKETKQTKRGMDATEQASEHRTPRVGAKLERSAPGYNHLARARQSYRVGYSVQGPQNQRTRGQGLDLRNRRCKLSSL